MVYLCYILKIYFFNKRTTGGSLSNQLHSTAYVLDLLLSKLADKLCTNNKGLVREFSLTQNFEVTVLGDINNWSRRGVLASSHAGIFTNKVPDLIKINNGAVEFVLVQVEVTHADLESWKVKSTMVSEICCVI